ncbi:MAG: hypothetical protein HYU52_07020 [Acidobacteria bacterium]|nr:hypothetical protein [Acidobacteriota bacterium]
MTRTIRTTLLILAVLAIPAPSRVEAKSAPDPCKFQKTIKDGGSSISIDVPAGEPCGLGTVFVTIIPKKGDPQTLRADRDGMITDASLVELNGALPPEIVIVAKGIDAAAYGSITIFEAVDGHYVERRVPRLTGDAAAGYAGRDTFVIKDGLIERDFPVYAPASEAGGEPQATGETRALRYDFGSDSWVAR